MNILNNKHENRKFVPSLNNTITNDCFDYDKYDR